MIKLVFIVSLFMALQEVHLQRSPYAGSANRFRGLPVNIAQEVSSVPSVSVSSPPVTQAAITVVSSSPVTQAASTVSSSTSTTQQPAIASRAIIDRNFQRSPYAGSVANIFRDQSSNIVPSIVPEVPTVNISPLPVTQVGSTLSTSISSRQQPETVLSDISQFPITGRFSNYDQFKNYHHHQHGYDYRGERDFDFYD